MFATTHLRSRQAPVRRGAAAVELAVTVPFLITLAFGMLEYNSVVMLKTKMVSAAYESARMATRPTTSQTSAPTAAAVSAYCSSLLTQLGVKGATVTVTPASLSSITPQTLVTVSISAPFNQNSLTTIVIGKTSVTTATASLIVE